MRQIQNDSVRQKQRIGDKAMGNKVTFDYSKVSGFVKDTEVESMKKIVAADERRAGITQRSRQ